MKNHKQEFMFKKILLIIVLAFCSQLSNAQSNYFQQEVNYKIRCSLNDNEHTISANISIDYINRSKDTLTYIYMHLWPNGYKDQHTALCQQELNQGNSALYFAEEKDRGYIDSLNFQVNGKPVEIEFENGYIDFCKLKLSEPLFPGQRAVITTPFKVKIPNGKFSRLGHIGQAYAITQWYPKPAVYDQYGWHQMPYLNQGEFYSEYGSFDVYITLPENYVVGATGDLVDDVNSDNTAEIARMNQLAVAAKNEVDVLLPNGKKDMTFPKSADKMKNLHFHQENIHDFGWFADKRYHVLKDEIVLDRNGKKVTTWSLFTNNEFDLWMKSPEYIKDALRYYSNWVGDYPYN
ncbi:MAG: M1 family peptidase, partial [Bacteroidota bacterium]